MNARALLQKLHKQTGLSAGSVFIDYFVFAVRRLQRPLLFLLTKLPDRQHRVCSTHNRGIEFHLCDGEVGVAFGGQQGGSGGSG